MGYSPWGCKELDTTERLHFLSFFNLSKNYEEGMEPFSNGRQNFYIPLALFREAIIGCVLEGNFREEDLRSQTLETGSNMPTWRNCIGLQNRLHWAGEKSRI